MSSNQAETLRDGIHLNSPVKGFSKPCQKNSRPFVRVRNRYPLILLTLCIGLIFSACTEEAPTTTTEPPPESDTLGPMEGDFFVTGIQVDQRLCYLGTTCDTGDVLFSDTVRTSFVMSLRQVPFSEDTLLASGLEGADKGAKILGRGYSAAYPWCTLAKKRSDCAYIAVDSDSLEIDIIGTGGWYFGGGQIKNDTLRIETRFKRRGIGAEFYLTGLKIKP